MTMRNDVLEEVSVELEDDVAERLVARLRARFRLAPQETSEPVQEAPKAPQAVPENALMARGVAIVGAIKTGKTNKRSIMAHAEVKAEDWPEARAFVIAKKWVTLKGKRSAAKYSIRDDEGLVRSANLEKPITNVEAAWAAGAS